MEFPHFFSALKLLRKEMFLKNGLKFNFQDDIMSWIINCLNFSIVCKKISLENKLIFYVLSAAQNRFVFFEQMVMLVETIDIVFVLYIILFLCSNNA